MLTSGSSALARRDLGIAVSFRSVDGVVVTADLADAWAQPFERLAPFRRPVQYKGQRNFTGSWWCATTGGHVGYESWAERDHVMLFDFAQAVGVDGAWYANAMGTVTRSLQSETEWGMRATAGHDILQTRYSVGRYEVTVGDMGVCSTYYQMEPISHEGGAESSAGSNPTATYCRNYEFDSKITLNQGYATNWTNGFSLKNIIGIDVKSGAGYSNSEKIVIEITAPGGRKICGTDTYPADWPSRVVVKPL